MSVVDEFPLAEDDDPSQKPDKPIKSSAQSVDSEGAEESRVIWAQLMEIGIAEPVLRLGTHLLVMIFIGIAIWGMRVLFLNGEESAKELEIPQRAALAAVGEEAQGDSIDTPVQQAPNVTLPEWTVGDTQDAFGIRRYALIHTTIPTRPRVKVTTYIVENGDTVFGIADKFGLQPETIFWGNREVLGDNPHNLRAGLELNILPVNGTYHKWSVGESFSKVASFYGVDPLAIVSWPGNPLDEYTFNIDNPEIEPDTYLIIPGGRRELIDWGPPRIPRDNPAVARTYGPGHCGTIVDGAVGAGGFIWPTTATYLSGYDYAPAGNHYGIDIAGAIGNPIYASDAGVVVYSGWSNYGYGYLIVLDHGNGWQSLYAHLSGINVGCGQSVFQGTSIGALGSTGNSSGPHLHFELMYGTAKVNPWNYVSP